MVRVQVRHVHEDDELLSTCQFVYISVRDWAKEFDSLV